MQDYLYHIGGFKHLRQRFPTLVKITMLYDGIMVSQKIIAI